MIDDIGVTCQFGNVTFTATPAEIRRSNDVMADGILNEADLEIVAVVSDIGDLPNVQQVITVSGIKYHVVERVVDPLGAVVNFVLRRI